MKLGRKERKICTKSKIQHINISSCYINRRYKTRCT